MNRNFLAISTGYVVKYLPLLRAVEFERLFIDERIEPLALEVLKGVEKAKKKIVTLPARANEEQICTKLSEYSLRTDGTIELKPSDLLFKLIANSGLPVLENGDLNYTGKALTQVPKYLLNPYLAQLESTFGKNSILPIVICYKKPKSDSVPEDLAKKEGERQVAGEEGEKE